MFGTEGSHWRREAPGPQGVQPPNQEIIKARTSTKQSTRNKYIKQMNKNRRKKTKYNKLKSQILKKIKTVNFHPDC